jgi:hypothetical protein
MRRLFVGEVWSVHLVSIIISAGHHFILYSCEHCYCVILSFVCGRGQALPVAQLN